MKPLTSRRHFLKTSSQAVATLASVNLLTSKSRAQAPLVIGHGDFRYEVSAAWGDLDPAKHPVANCHEMTEDSKGRLILFQTDPKNNILIYSKSGELLDSWGTDYPGAHGLDIIDENGEEFLFLTDVKKSEVYKTTLDGKVVMTLGRPDLDVYADPKAPFKPTNVMPAPDGTFYVGDGYGSSWVMHYSADGQLLNFFGGKGTDDKSLNTPHGGIVDTRDPANPTLMIASRSDNALKRFTLGGEYLSRIDMPGMRVCQVAQQGDYLVTPHLEGLLSVVDQNNVVVSNPGGDAVETFAKAADSPFQHPHGLWVDAEDNIYIAQWNSGKTYPIKLTRV